uniref:EGF-like domain-containing protein n=1 Tax=Anopheles coluzzii TaxID=1518534 RepID=A0A6E8VW17_ANOCL|nr:zonadhesin-like [Anopheles coluzzii]
MKPLKPYQPSTAVVVLLLLFAVILPNCRSLATDETAAKKPPKRTVKKMILLDHTPVLPHKVRLLEDCSRGASTNCTRTCPDSYTVDARQQYCRPKRQDGICPPGYVQRAGVGGAAGCVLEQIHCPPGSKREGNRCVVRSYSCPPGYVQRGQSCVRDNICQPGYRWESGLCFPASARIFCPPGFTEQHPGGGNCAPAACSDCCDCREEVVATICPSGYSTQWGRCVRHQQASPDLRIHSVTYRLPVECAVGQTFNGGQCETVTTVGRPVCRSGHFYNGSCVEVAKCVRGTLNGVCSCEQEQHVASACAAGKVLDGVCVISRAHCKPPAKLRNGVCVRETRTRPHCPEGGVPYQREYCALEAPRCARGFTLDEHGLCRRGTHACTFECGLYQRLNRWCGLPANCPEGYTLSEAGHCLREKIRPAYSCPEGTVERGDRCVSVSPLCRSNYRYDPGVDLCTRCDERAMACARGNLTGGQCVWSEPACPAGHEWKDSVCVRNDTRRYSCRKGYEHGEQCVHGELTCPTGGYELQGEVCTVREDVHCPEGSYAVEGRCTIAKECPEGFLAGADACVREVRRLANATEPTCPAGYAYEGDVCIRRTVVEASVSRKDAVCPDGYERGREERCVRLVRTFPVCPPRTIYTDRSDRCYCEVDLMCPTGYERTGTDCTYRAAGYTSLVNFLNPCYGAFCGGGGAYCITQCSFPPCPFEPCAAGGLTATFGPRATRCLTPGAGDNDCPPQTIIGLVCPPGYERVNSSCLAYYDKVCPAGYELDGEECTQAVHVAPICPSGYRPALNAGSTCIQTSCPNGYKLTGTGLTCEKRELRSPKSCPPGWDFFQGACHRRTLCRNGTIEGAYCVEREFTRPTCPEGYIQRGEDCTTQGTCRTIGATLIDGMCVRIEEPAPCPEGTYRHGRHCVYPDAPECEDVQHVATQCTSEIDSRGYCWQRTAPTCPQGYRLRDDRCIACQSEKPNCPAHLAIRQEMCTAERVACPAGHFLRDGYCVTVDVTRPRCPAGDFTLCNGFCIVPYVHECKAAEYGLATCSRGFLQHGKCVEHARCADAHHTLVGGECQLRTFVDASCHGKGTRVGELCIGGTPKCPPSYALTGGQCYSCQVENAQCATVGASCAESFCQLEPPRCSSSGAMFDGRSCRQLVTSKPVCPTGTSPDRYEPRFCQLKSERAVYNCPAEHHYQNGVCLKKLYKTPSCPADYKLRNGACVKRICSRMSSGSACGDVGGPLALTTGPTVSCAQCLNETAGTMGGGSWSSTAPTQNGVDLCCMVYSPRICRDGGECRHEQERLCGSFCLTEDDRIYLTVSRTVRVGNRLYVAPAHRSGASDYNDEDDEDEGDDEDHDEGFGTDCAQCEIGPANCAKHCNTYDCEEQDEEECNFKEANTFCAQYRGAKICEHFSL